RSFSWMVPGGSFTQVRVRVRALDVNANILAADTTDGTFTIGAAGTPLSITVTSPNGGENWTAGSTHSVTWTISGETSHINYQLVAYSTDAGSTYSNIGSAQTPIARSFTWTLPGTLNSSNVKVRVRALDVGTNILAAGVSGALTISPAASNPTVAITPPSG